MKRRHPQDDEPTLFDPPLRDESGEPDLGASLEEGSAEATEAVEPSPQPRRREASKSSPPHSLPLSLPLFPELEDEQGADRFAAEEDEQGAELGDVSLAMGAPLAQDPGLEAEIDPEIVPFRLRLLAGVADLAVHGAVLLLALVSERLVGIAWSLDQWPGLAVFLVTFSFLYTVVPLAFWGQTPGMSIVGILASTEEGENLSFPQTAVRWAAGLLTVLLFGLPLALTLAGPSLGERLSGSVTRRVAI